MFNRKPLAVVLVSFCAALVHPAATGERAIWSRQAIAFDLQCSKRTTKRQTIVAPDRKTKFEAFCGGGVNVITPDGQAHDVEIGWGAHELLWAPNSKAFLVNGGFNAYSGFFTTAYLISPGDIRKIEFTEAAQQDMVASFPPCKALNRDANKCASIAKDPQFNVSGVAWLPDSSGVAVFAEVPCSSFYGGVMCQVLGYELKVPEGTILKRMTAKEFNQKWGSHAAWHINIPDPPEYGPANVTFPPSPAADSPKQH
jgi:hypothetical protein